jgi:hypothetical protein
MGGILFGILASLIQLGVMVGIVVLIVKLVSGRGRASTESVGVLIRRFFVYTIMLVMLAIVGIGITGLIEAALPAADEITDSSSAAARSIAFVIVGLPVYLGLGHYTVRRLRTDPNEQDSLGWAFYLTVALIGSLIAAMAVVGGMLSELASGEGLDQTLAVNAIVWGGVWVAHWWVAEQYKPRGRGQIQLLAGSAAGVIWSFIGAIATVTAMLSIIYEGLFFESVSGNGIEDLLRPVMILAVGVPVWWWYWFRHARDGQRTPWWLAYTLLVGVMGGAITAIAGVGIMMFSVLDWLLGDVSSSAAAHFDLIPGGIAALLIGGGAWAYHAHVLGDRDERSRGEVDRVYDYLLSAAGLFVAASGLVTLIAVALMGISATGSTVTRSGDAVATALTLLLIGGPLWWRYWATIQRYRRSDCTAELHSIPRRIYILGLFGVAAIVAVVSLIVIVFIVVEDALDGTLGANTLDSTAIAIALLMTAGALAMYHLSVFREDREVTPDPKSFAVEDVLFISATDTPLPHAIRNRIGANVRSVAVAESGSTAKTLDEVIEALEDETHRQVLIIHDGEGQYDVMAIED